MIKEFHPASTSRHCNFLTMYFVLFISLTVLLCSISFYLPLKVDFGKGLWVISPKLESLPSRKTSANGCPADNNIIFSPCTLCYLSRLRFYFAAYLSIYPSRLISARACGLSLRSWKAYHHERLAPTAVRLTNNMTPETVHYNTRWCSAFRAAAF